MADYYSPTVVRPSISADAITSLELAVLKQMFEFEADGDAIYFFSSEGPSDTIWLDIETLKAGLAEHAERSKALADMVREALAAAGNDDEEIELDLSDLGGAEIFQGIVRRCEGLSAVVITSAWTCTKMRPDGFGGGVTVVTADHILSSSTAQMECELLDRAESGESGGAPGQETDHG
jgi:hypothetical protein